MIRIVWQGEELVVGRVVLRRDRRAGAYHRPLCEAADRGGLAVADQSADPRPGDFWVGCSPEAGWGDADPARTGWAGLLEVPLALRQLRRGVPAASPN
jgi:hypothetical protein